MNHMCGELLERDLETLYHNYSRLGYSFLFGTEYLKNDCLKFRVIKVTLFNI